MSGSTFVQVAHADGSFGPLTDGDNGIPVESVEKAAPIAVDTHMISTGAAEAFLLGTVPNGKRWEITSRSAINADTVSGRVVFYIDRAGATRYQAAGYITIVLDAVEVGPGGTWHALAGDNLRVVFIGLNVGDRLAAYFTAKEISR